MIQKGKSTSRASLPLKYYGGSQPYLKHVYEIIPPHTHSVETHCGGSSFSLLKPWEFIEGHSEVINDLNGELTNFWTVLQYAPYFEEFSRRVSVIPFSQQGWKNANELYEGGDPVTRAVLFFVNYRQSRMGIGEEFATLSKNRVRRGMNEQVSAWLSSINGLREAHLRLQRIVIMNMDACELIRKEDGPNTFYFVDPPFLEEVRQSIGQYRKYETTIEHHINVLDTLRNIKGKFILCGYQSKLYNEQERAGGWNRKDILLSNSASSAKKKDKETQCLWYNF